MSKKLTLKQAAKYTDYSISYIRKKLLKGDLSGEKKSFQYGKKWVIPKKELDSLVKKDKKIKEIIEVSEPLSRDELKQAINQVFTEEIVENLLKRINNTITEQNQDILNQINKINQNIEKLKNNHENLINQLDKLMVEVINKIK